MGQRLTERTPTGVGYVGNRTKYPGIPELNQASGLRVAAVREILARLAEYEDTGLAPEEIAATKQLMADAMAPVVEMVAAMAPQLAQAVRDAMQRLTPEQIMELLQGNCGKVKEETNL